ncbi:MAG: hypothetical protein JW744_02605 [Candidatus Diapherotrites archaeon]|uniref:Uncharacterized protein n=1 Tax=Candidatus Iainarchaeum sp. TaxID=3101447 RepID=A0A938YXV3_9ARCH|nr:hypothetical protein [Candidatus Diapherotrites archaeon]
MAKPRKVKVGAKPRARAIPFSQVAAPGLLGRLSRRIVSLQNRISLADSASEKAKMKKQLAKVREELRSAQKAA